MYRSMRINFRTRWGITPDSWNWFFDNLYNDISDIIGPSGMVGSGVINWDNITNEYEDVLELAGSGCIGWLEE